ncbi:MAG: hypothetical protein HYZ85_00700 [Candidatus Omnitrophica bacterium]|nr:hypothetical protein [Candidatus Omnitrophota bacterium]
MSCKQFVFILWVTAVFNVSSSWAKITVDPAFQGTLVITSESGEISLYEVGESIGEIPQGASLEVFDGSFQLTLEAGDKISVECLTYTFDAQGPSSLTLTCGENEGTLEAVKGDIKGVSPEGEALQIKEGTAFPLKWTDDAGEVPPTAEGETVATTPEPSDPAPPDSRSIQSSPS